MTRTIVRLSVCFSLVYCILVSCTLPILAQSSASADSVVPAMVKFSGTLNDVAGKPLTGTVGVTFLLYKEQAGGAPLWIETQNVQADKNGHYSVMLGAATSHGIPSEAFAAGQARWLAVQPSGQDEQPRVVLVSVPYALKALDAETVGGLPASAFLRTNATPTKGSSMPATKTQVPQTNPAVTGKGVVNFVPLWNSTSDIVDSLIFQKSSSIGISTKTPAATLDVNGKGDVRDTLTLFPKGTDPTLAINGTAFKVDATGKVTFVSGQTFPGGNGSGTVTSVGLSAPSSDFIVSGSPITKSGTLGLNWNVAPTSSDTVNAIVKRDASGSFSTGEIFANSIDIGVSAMGANNGLYGTTTNSSGNGVWGYNPNHTGVYGDGGVGVWGHSGTGYGVYGASFGTTATSDGVHGEASSGTASGVAGVNGGSGGVGVYGTGTLEGLVAIISGAMAGSISLVGFGIDSFIEVTSGSTLLWRMSVDADEQRRERNEKLSLKIVGVCFLALAVYVGYESVSDLLSRKQPEHSIPGIVLACVSLVVMPLLSRAKKKVGNSLSSAATRRSRLQPDLQLSQSSR